MPQSSSRWQKGFTLQEMLIVLSITIILLGISVVGILSYMWYLQLAQLDNSAKEIFMAAQNRAILLSNGHRFEPIVVKADGSNRMDHVEVIPDSLESTQITAYYIHCADTSSMDDLLPRDTIDPTLWDGDFYIVYEPESGSVVDVFFSTDVLPVEEDFSTFYDKWRTASKFERMRSNPMIGYYGGYSAESGSTLSLRTPVINIYNENTLRVEITHWIPRTLISVGQADNVTLNVTLDYQGQTLTLSQDDAESKEEPGLAYLARTSTWTLDSLEDGKKFRDLFSVTGLTFGDDFTITAHVLYTGDLKVNGARKIATDNSLFAKDSTEDTAYITCLRHLQNLDTDFSGVDGKIYALQKADVSKVEEYLFQPIDNSQLKSYDGGNYSIFDLNIVPNDHQIAGLFGTLEGSLDSPKKLENIRLVGTASKAEGVGGVAGALVGTGKDLELKDCHVYWENRSDENTDLRQILGNSKDGLWYQITGSHIAGGLAGKLENSRITDCFSATLANSQNIVGGLVGEAQDVTVVGSYSSSYVKGPHTGGLVGNLSGQGEFSACYAVGFIDSDQYGEAAGFCLGTGDARMSNSYSAMLFTADETITNYPLCQNGSYYKTYYLESELYGFVGGYENLSRSYSQFIDPDQWGSMFDQDIFFDKTAAQSHPYNLQTTLSLTTYIYPGLEKLDHWGDWGAQFQDGSLVYYELYSDGTYGFKGIVNHLSQRDVVEDGFAVAYQSTDSIAGLGVTLQVTYQTAAGEKNQSFTYNDETNIHQVENVKDSDGNINTYYLLPLDETVVNTDYAAQYFYQKITITDEEDVTRSYYYNPHFANDPLDYNDRLPLDQLARQLQVVVRSPRHLYMLSRFSTYYASTNQYRFTQQLDLNYATYTGYELFQDDTWTQAPIGLSANNPFRGNYSGKSYRITGVKMSTSNPNGGNYQYFGLFGYNTGVIQNVLYEMNHAVTITQKDSNSPTLYAASLVGYNGGTVQNCAASGVEIGVNCYTYSTAYVGGLVGLNRGAVRCSSAEVLHINAITNLSNAYAGGFVGQNTAGGAIDQCYAVGKVSASRARYGTVNACGFAGSNQAILKRSYAAVYLTAEGGAVSYGFSGGSSTDCVYLNAGNFTYREEDYTAQYQDPAAQPVTWPQLAGQEESSLVAALGMYGNVDALDSEQSYPYVGSVTNSVGNPIHLGQWPDRMILVEMGVYYWEKLTISGVDSYHFHVLSLDTNGKIEEISTLSTIHGDGGIVKEYGYGYYYDAEAENPPTLESQDIYWDNRLFTTKTAQTNETANQELASLMSQKYVFHSYNTWQADKQQGLHLMVVNGKNDANVQPPVGKWTLMQEDLEFDFYLNPFFAASISYENDTLPGSQEHPYQVRSIEQLQFINWFGLIKGNQVVDKTVNRIAGTGDGEGYIFLNNWRTGQNLRQYSWVQTHDLDGSHIDDYTPIAALYDDLIQSEDPNLGRIVAWFSGSYNGNDYTIQEVSISTNNVNTTGLFGVTVDAQLRNIVLYSPSGKATITSSNSQESWYAIGGLVGLAANTVNAGSNRTIENCAIAGYTILDKNTQCKYGGGGVGGLVGICNMALKNCVAVTDIQIAYKHDDNARNVRVGGVAGSCQQSISNCYSGGSISLGDGFNFQTNSRLHIGGITGGYFMKTLSFAGGNVPNILSGLTDNQVPSNSVTQFNNCYTYVQISQDMIDQSDSYYTIGGLGEIYRTGGVSRVANYRNCYYLSNGTQDPALDKDQDGITSCSFGDLTEGGKAYENLLLNGFDTVTTKTSGGELIDGRYSFSVDLSLLGKNYPFPTILTQSSNVTTTGWANVHYGNWVVEGIRREHGALPVNLDLFADYDETEKAAVWLEELTLSGVNWYGEWAEPTVDDPTVVEAELSGDNPDHRTLKIIGKKEGSTQVHITYTVNDREYTLEIEVNVTANLRVAPAGSYSQITGFTQSTVDFPLVLLDQDNEPLSQDLIQSITLDHLTAEVDSSYFQEVSISQEDGLILNGVCSELAGVTQMTVGYDFQYLEGSYTSTSVLTAEILDWKASLGPLEFFFPSGSLTSQTESYNADDFVLLVEDTPQALKDLTIIGFEEVLAEFRSIIWVDWDNPNQPEGVLSVTGYPQESYPASAAVNIQLQFGYEGGTHTLWEYLYVQIDQEEEALP